MYLINDVEVDLALLVVLGRDFLNAHSIAVVDCSDLLLELADSLFQMFNNHLFSELTFMLEGF